MWLSSGSGDLHAYRGRAGQAGLYRHGKPVIRFFIHIQNNGSGDGILALVRLELPSAFRQGEFQRIIAVGVGTAGVCDSHMVGGTNTYTADKLKEVTISSDVTFIAEVKQLYTLTYDLNGGFRSLP